MAQIDDSIEKESKIKYCCVTCGIEVDELAHCYKEGVIKIIHCVREHIVEKL